MKNAERIKGINMEIFLCLDSCFNAIEGIWSKMLASSSLDEEREGYAWHLHSWVGCPLLASCNQPSASIDLRCWTSGSEIILIAMSTNNLLGKWQNDSYDACRSADTGSIMPVDELLRSCLHCFYWYTMKGGHYLSDGPFEAQNCFPSK